MTRVLRIELRRSAAPGAGLGLLAFGVVLLFFAEGNGFTTGYMQLAMTQRLYLAVLWPLALAAGAWQATRERRAKVGELFATTPRPRAVRAVPTLGAMAVAVVGAYLTTGLVGAAWIVRTAGYLPIAAPVVTAVGGLTLVAAVWIGLAVGRLWPWLATAPLLGIAGVGLLLLLPAATRPRGWLALVFSPLYEMNMPIAYATVPGRASAAQAIWFAALAATAALLFASGSPWVRAAALLPVVLGAALAVTVMPHRDRVVHAAIDPVARELVCSPDTPRVCLSRVHAGRLAEVTPRARAGLAALAKLPDAPVEVHEDTTTYLPDHVPPWRADVVLLDVEAGPTGHVGGDVAAAVAAGAFAGPPDCARSAGPAELLAAAHWLLGRTPVARDDHDREDVTAATELWQALRQLPPGEADARVAALRRAAVTCSVGDDPLAGNPR